ncbi:MAG: DUF2510 domain-containing protein [Cryobacterium sp.]|nr:DUF2510 domain-containing protein [Cryobacterium sp.]
MTNTKLCEASNTTNPPSGWYPDSVDPTKVRWWNGLAWTEYSADRYQQSSTYQTAPLRAKDGTNWNTVWIWVISLLPIINLWFRRSQRIPNSSSLHRFISRTSSRTSRDQNMFRMQS